MKNGEFCTTMIYPFFSRSVCFAMGSPAWWRFGLCSSGSSPVTRWRDAPLERKFQMWRRRCKQIDPHWFQGRFWWIWSTISWKYSIIYPVRLFSTAVLTRSLLHPIFNSLLVPATACESQATACDIEISLDMLWIGVNCIFNENIFSTHWSISFLTEKYFISIFITFYMHNL